MRCSSAYRPPGVTDVKLDVGEREGTLATSIEWTAAISAFTPLRVIFFLEARVAMRFCFQMYDMYVVGVRIIRSQSRLTQAKPAAGCHYGMLNRISPLPPERRAGAIAGGRDGGHDGSVGSGADGLRQTPRMSPRSVGSVKSVGQEGELRVA